MKKITYLLLVGILLTSAVSYAQGDPNHNAFVGKWKSEKFDSMLILEEKNGKFDATFTSGNTKMEILECKPIVEYGVYKITLSWYNDETDYNGWGQLVMETADSIRLETPNPNSSSSYGLGGTKSNVNVNYYIRIKE